MRKNGSSDHIDHSASASGGVRLNKALADAGLCSRRKADELIAQGAVRVNGNVVRELGTRVEPETDHISVHGRMLDPPPAARVWLLLNKPVRVVSTVHDPQGRPTVLDILPDRLRGARLFPVGRLDYFSEGLILLTDDGELAQRLLHPRNHAAKVYHVLLRESPGDAALQNMRTGMRLAEGEQLAPIRVRALSSSERLPYFPRFGTLLEMTLVQGVNRQIRRMCRDLRLTVLRLARVRQGPIRLGNLPSGAVRELTPDELAELRSAK